MVGIRCFFLFIASFASLMSIQIRASSDFLGTAIMGLIKAWDL